MKISRRRQGGILSVEAINKGTPEEGTESKGALTFHRKFPGGSKLKAEINEVQHELGWERF